MIAVLADDLTGAAELGAVGLRYGLAAEVQIDRFEPTGADLVILDTGTRSLRADRAAAVVRKAVRGLADAGAEWIYKKVDFVLRGPVRSELEAIMDALDRSRVLLVPANPSMGRTIRDGRYFVNGRLLHQTDFANDPEHPARNSEVLAMLGTGRSVPCVYCTLDRPMPTKGIVVGEVTCGGDLSAWAKRLEGDTVPAGGAEFFAALLAARGHAERPATLTEPLARNQGLFVCGSTSAYSRQTIARAREGATCVVSVPPERLAGSGFSFEALREWVDAAVAALQTGASPMITIGQPLLSDSRSAATLSRRLAEIVAGVLNHCRVGNLYVEGGATATAVTRRLGWNRFSVRCELAPGTVSMRVDGQADQWLTIKPGSYPWPRELLERLNALQ